MKKIYKSILLFFIVLFEVYSQKITILNNKEVYTGNVGEEIHADFKIRNISYTPIYITIYRIRENILKDEYSYFCLGDRCLEQGQKQLIINQPLKSGEEYSLKSVLKAGESTVSSKLTYLIYETNNPEDNMILDVQYRKLPSNSRDVLYFSSKIIMKELFPNPVSDEATLSYSIGNNQVEAKIVLHDILGSSISEFELSPLANNIKIDTQQLNQGVYFYSLYVGGQGVSTHKLVIKR